MKKISNNAVAGIIGFALVALFAFLVLATPADATIQPDNCAFDPETQFKYEVDQDIWLPNDPGITLIVVSEKENEVTKFAAPEGWVIICQKAPHDNAGISHVVVERSPPSSSTTTTTSIPTTTTTTVKETTTTNGKESTTTTNPQETTTSAPSGTTTPEAPTTTGNETTGETLPFTGVGELGTLSAIGLVLLGLGVLLLTFFRRNQE